MALSTPERTYTWQEVAQQVNQVAAQLHAQGVHKEDVLTCVGKNSTQLVFVYLACLELGAVCAMTMPQSRQELRHKLNTLYANEKSAKVWLTQPNAELANLQTVFIDDKHNDIGGVWTSSYLPNQLVSIVFTSGSTGAPKAVVHNSQQHLASASGLLTQFHFIQGDSWLLSLPMYHVSGLAIIYRWLFSGALLKVGRGQIVEDISGVTHASLVSTQLKRLLEAKTPLSLTHVLLGGSHVPLELSRQAAQQGMETWLGYGMTESASTVTAKRIDAIESAGKILPNRKLKLDGQRILIGGETLASGYYQQGKLHPLTEHEWFDSKDLGEWVGDELKIIGRVDNQFISGGENIHCEEIEAALCQVPNIKQAVVVPVEDSEYGHRPVAVIVSETQLDQASIEQHLNRSLVKFKWPVAYYAMPEALCEGGIKISRQKVKQWLTTEVN